MWKKIKEFFNNGTVQVVEGVIIALAAGGLIIGNVDNVPELLQTIGKAVGTILAAIEALITIIHGIHTNKDQKKVESEEVAKK